MWKPLAVVTVGVIVLVLSVYLWPFTGNQEQWDNVRNCQISDLQMMLTDENGNQIDEIGLKPSAKHKILISGSFAGAANWEFEKFARSNHLFRVSLANDGEIEWHTSPGKIDLPATGKFQFSCVIMLPDTTPTGDCVVNCHYYDESVGEIPVRVVR